MKTPKILIVDDEGMNLMIYRSFIGKYHTNILTAENGLLGVETYHNNPDIDLIIMNYQMPIMNGMEANIEIRKFNKEIPIIMISGSFCFVDVKEEGLKSGANYCMIYPIKFHLLIEKIEEYLGYKLINK